MVVNRPAVDCFVLFKNGIADLGVVKGVGDCTAVAALKFIVGPVCGRSGRFVSDKGGIRYNQTVIFMRTIGNIPVVDSTSGPDGAAVETGFIIDKLCVLDCRFRINA